MIKILILGDNKAHNIEYNYAKYFNIDLSITCEIYPSYDLFNKILNKSKFNKIVNRLNVNWLLGKINKNILIHVKQFQPDIVWIFKGMEILPETIIEIKKNGSKVINYNPDHPFLFSGIGSGNKNVTNSFSLFDYHVTYNQSLKVKIEQQYGIPTFLLPFGYELNDAIYKNISKIEEINKVCFIGNPDKTRIKFISYLLENNIQITVFGHGWSSKLKGFKNCEIFDAVYHEKMWENMYKYRIQLNIFREHNEGSHNMRTFEIPAIGGIQLAPDTIEHRGYFEQEKEIFLYNNMLDCLNQINKILGLSSNQVALIKLAARKHSIDSEYSYEERAKKVAIFFKSIS